MDIKSASLYGKIEEKVYVCQPPGFKDPNFPDRVYKVEKALYGLHQAPRAWYETLSTYLLDNEFQRGKIDMTLFIKRYKGDILLVQVYVDDIIFGSTKNELCNAFKKFTKVKTASIPMETQKPLLKDKDGKEVYVHMYRSMIDSLMYLTSLRPNIMFVVYACARYQVNPKVSHLHVVKRIFRYLKGQPKLGLWYLKDSPFDLVAYIDSDYVGASLNRKSTTRCYQFLRCRLISWQCKKQTVVANSITEAEYMAASKKAKKSVRLMMEKLVIRENRQSDLVSKIIERVGKNKNRKRAVWNKNRQSDLVSKRIERICINLILLVKVNAARHNLLVLVKVNAARHNLLLLGYYYWAKVNVVEESDGFEQIVDFLNANPIRYALTINPTIYISCIEQFWSTVKAKTVNEEVQLHALVDGKKIIITKSIVRRDLQLEDVEGVDWEKERDKLKQTLEKFQNSSKSLNDLLESQVIDKFKTGLEYNAATTASPAVESFVNLSDKSGSDKGYHSVPPPLTWDFIPHKPDLTFMDEIVESENLDVTTVVTPSNDKTVKNKGVSNTVESNTVRRKCCTLINEELVSDGKKKTVFPTVSKIEFVGPKQPKKPVRKPVKYAKMYKSQRPRGNQRNWNNHKSQQLGSDFVMYSKACFVCGSFDHLKKDCSKTSMEQCKEEDDLEDPSKQGRKITKIDQDPSISLVQHDAEIQGRHKHEPEFDLDAVNIPVSTAGAEISTANPEVKTTGDSIEDIAVETLVYIRKSAAKAKDKGKAKMEESESAMTKTKRQQEQERLSFEVAVRLQAELDKEDRQRISRAKDKAVYKELDDSLVRAATTASSLEAEQDSGNIIKTRSKATPNEVGSQGTTSGGGPRHQETMRDRISQTRFENVSKLSNDLLLPRGNTLQSGEDSLKLNELMELYTNLQQRVLDLETTKTIQANEIASLKRRVKKLEKKDRSRTHKLKRLYKVSLSAKVESSRDKEDLGEDASKQGRRIHDINTDEDITLVNDDNKIFDVDALAGEEVFFSEQSGNVVKEVVVVIDVASTIPVSAATITDVKITLAQALAELKSAKPKADKDKGKGIMIEEPVVEQVKPMKRLEQIRLDEELTFKLQAKEEEEEERLAREKAQQIKKANIVWDDVQAKVEVDYQLAQRLTELVEESSKKAKTELEEDLKKAEAEVMKAELQSLIEVIPDEEEIAIDVVPLATKPPTIVDWKIHKEGKKCYYQIIRADGKSQMYRVFSQMLKCFSREDMEDFSFIEDATCVHSYVGREEISPYTIYNYRYAEQEALAIKGKATTDEVMMTEYLFSMEGEEFEFVFETKDGAATIREYMQTLTPQLKVESNVIDTFSLKKANGKYDEEKQFEAFSKTIQSEFKKDPEIKNMKDLEMAFFPIISHEHYYLVVFNFLKGNTVIIDNSKTQMTYDEKYKTICELMIVAFFDDAYGALQWGDCKELEPRIPDRNRRKYIRYNKDEGEVGNKDTES
ncbi:putative ribonuclease H-like domain-containing protein [Tanacetum coccineum]